MTKLKDCKKEFFPCKNCGANLPFADKESCLIYRCWKCGRRVSFIDTKQQEVTSQRKEKK